MINKKILNSLPKSPGVYKFYDNSGKLIYVGKATSIRSRVGSYFSGAHDNKTEMLVSKIKKIKFEVTETVLEALILEANLIKKNQPKYNIKAKDDKSFSYFLITKNDKFPRILIVRETDLGKYPAKNLYGPYTSKRQMEIALSMLRKIFPFHAGKQKTEKGCLDFQIGLCPGPYAGKISERNYQKNIRGIEMILKGKKNPLLKKLEKEMLLLSRKKEYEKARELRDQMFSLKHLRDVSLIKTEESSFFPQSKDKMRIEAYDISNISGDYAVGSMVVFSGEETDKKNYRKFKIKFTLGIDDVAMMKEILTRRLKRAEWDFPNLIILDGGKGHLNMAQKLLKDFKLEIPLLAVAKGPTRKKLDKYFSKNITSVSNLISSDLLIEKIRDEAHRFAIGYHRKLRRKEWMK